MFRNLLRNLEEARVQIVMAANHPAISNNAANGEEGHIASHVSSKADGLAFAS